MLFVHNSLIGTPMSKTFTLNLTIHNLASKSNEEVLNIDTAFNFNEEFHDVFDVLNFQNFDVRQEVVDNILRMTTKST
jgi:hypothetical protein